MKVAIILALVCLLSGAHAQEEQNIFQKLGGALKDTAGHVAANGKTILEGILGQLQQAGGQLLQSTLLKLMENLGTTGIGKRDVELLTKLQQGFKALMARLEEKKQKVGGLMNHSMTKLKEVMEKLSKLSFISRPVKEVEKEIDEAVAHHETTVKRFVQDTFKDLGNQLLEQLKQVGQNALTGLLGQLAGQVGKRAITDGLQGLVDFFKPHVQSIVDQVKGLGETLKGHANNLLTTVNTHAGQLKEKLSGHVDQLKQHGQTLLGHGQNAVEALKSAVTDILKQTFTNMKPTLDGASNSLKNVAGTVTGHLVDALKNGSN